MNRLVKTTLIFWPGLIGMATGYFTSTLWDNHPVLTMGLFILVIGCIPLTLYVLEESL